MSLTRKQAERLGWTFLDGRSLPDGLPAICRAERFLTAKGQNVTQASLTEAGLLSSIETYEDMLARSDPPVEFTKHVMTEDEIAQSNDPVVPEHEQR
jgi:hypothetical protein